MAEMLQSLKSSLWLLAGLAPACPQFSSTEEPELDEVQQDKVSPVLSKGEESPPSAC